MHHIFTSATRSATEPCALTATHCNAQLIYIQYDIFYCHTVKHPCNMHHIFTSATRSATEPCALTATHCNAQPIYTYHEPKHAYIHISFIHIRNRALRTDCNTLQRATHINMSCSAYVFVDVVCVFVDVVYVFVDVLSLHVM